MTDFARSQAERTAAPRADASPPRVPAFRWSWKLATVSGIDVYVHGTFLLLIAFLAFGGFVAGQGLQVVVRTTFLLIAVFTTVVLHEFGHALMARRFGVRTQDITLLPIGGIARLERMPEKPMQQLLVAFAGPAVNIAIALAIFIILLLPTGRVAIETFRYADGSFLAQLMWINVSLAVFNLLPGYPMDGGRVLRALLAMRLPPERATQTAARVGQGVAVLFGLVGGLFASPLLIVIAVFVWLGAQAEHSVSTLRVALAGLSVGQGMITDFRTVAPTDPISRAVELTLAGFQRDFPVMDDQSRLVGVLTHADVLRGLAERGAAVSVQKTMQEGVGTANPSEALDGALMRIHQNSCGVLVVMDKGEVVGLLTPGNLGELIALEAAGWRAKKAQGSVGP